jgi:hypothetical protein
MNKRFLFILLIVLAGLIGIFFLGERSKPDEANENQTTQENIGVLHENQGQAHIAVGAEHEPYNSNPPSSGPHYSVPADWGIKDEPIVDETLVHNLEHGGILIAYKPDLGEQQVNELKEIFNRLPKSARFGSIKAVLVPRAANTHPVQLAAWTYTLDLTEIDESKIVEFYSAHIDKGPELVP